MREEGSKDSLEKALQKYQQARLLFQSINDASAEANTLLSIGIAYHLQGERQKALDNLTLALSIFRTVSDLIGEAMALYNVAYVERNQGKLTEARAHIEAAITIIESLRSKIASQELRASYFATVQDYYAFYTDLLMRLHKQSPNNGYDGKALQMSERARARCSKCLPSQARIYVRALSQN